MPVPHSNQNASEEFLSLGEVLAIAERGRTTIICTALVVVSVATVYTLTRTPVYRASATLRLEQESEGPLADLAALTRAPAAESEIALFGSRSLASEVVAAPPTWTAHEEIFRSPASGRFEEIGSQNLDLATIVTSDGLSPFASLKRSLGGDTGGPHRLYASFDVEHDRAVAELRVTFINDYRVRIARTKYRGWAESDPHVYTYSASEPIEYGGVQLRLSAVGDYVGQSYRVSRIPQRSAVASLMARTTVRETARNSGVLVLTVEDVDPNRAAESANALAQNYFLSSVRLGSLRAERTLGFIEAELERVLAQLDAAEKEVVEQSAAHSQAINISATSKAMIDALASYAAEQTQVVLMRRTLSDAMRQIDAGDLRGLSLLGPSLHDPLTVSHIKAIAELRASAVAVDRPFTGSYMLFLQRDVLDLESERDRLALEVRLLTSSLEQFIAGDAEALAQIAGDEPSEDPVAMRYLDEIAILEGELARLETSVTAEHPDRASRRSARATLIERLVNHTTAELAALESRVLEHDGLIAAHEDVIRNWSTDERGRIDDAATSLIALVRDNLTSQLAGLDTREAILDEAIAGIELQLSALPEHERNLADPMRRREAFDRIAKILLESQQQAQLARAATMPSAVLLDPAVPSTSRTSPRIVPSIGISVVFGAVLGLALAWLRSALRDSLRTQAALEEATGLSVIGSVPDFSRGALGARHTGPGFVPMRDDHHGFVAESYRSIREALLFALGSEDHVQTFAATSCVAEEGKTITNIDLAMAFAGGGRRVLLVDADMRMPAIGEYFDGCEGDGLAEALEGRLAWRDGVVASDYRGLDLLPAGRPVKSPNDLLRSDRAKQLLAEFKGAYNHVVFDLPPAMLVSDVETFADELDAVALVYRTDGASRAVLKHTVQRLRQSGVNLVGVVLNFVNDRSTASYDAYVYGYGGDRWEETGRNAG